MKELYRRFVEWSGICTNGGELGVEYTKCDPDNPNHLDSHVVIGFGEIKGIKEKKYMGRTYLILTEQETVWLACQLTQILTEMKTGR